MLGFGLQFALATVAALRGWGFAPFGLILFAFGLGYVLRHLSVYPVVVFMLLAADWIVIGILALMVFVQPDEERAPTASVG